jgi:hypothetical protein
MSKDIYILANLIIDETNEFPWMCSVPLIETKFHDHKNIQLIQDLHLNFMLNKNDKIKMSLYKLNVNKLEDFNKKRSQIFMHKNTELPDIKLLGFQKIKDFLYTVNKKERTQYFDDISLTFSYTENTKIPKGQYYIDCPFITIPNSI